MMQTVKRRPRILSLLPSSTEIVYLLELEKYLVGRSHDSDFPRTVRSIPVVSATTIDISQNSRAIDTQVRESTHQGRSLYHLNTKLVQKLNPSLILTQELCPVCAISFTEVQKASRYFASDVSLLSLEPETLNDMFENIITIASLTEREEQAESIIKTLRQRLKKIQAFLPAKTTPTVVIIEWPDPLMTAGHWVPEMVKIAGGKLLLSSPGISERITVEKVLKADPDIIIFAPCGFSIDRTRKEIDSILTQTIFKNLRATREHQVFLMDGDAYLTRPGPRLVAGVEILAQIFFPDIYGTPKKKDALRYR